ncbi:MAG: hypothetical protein ABFE13_23070 [Phycisphaerales bacterium]
MHTDGRVATSTEAPRVLAYTRGPHIASTPGRFSPVIGPGLRLLAYGPTCASQQSAARDITGLQIKGTRSPSSQSVLFRKAISPSRESLKKEKLEPLPKKSVEELGLLMRESEPDSKKRQAIIDKVVQDSGLQARLPQIEGNRMWYEPNLVAVCKQGVSDEEQRKDCDNAIGLTRRVMVPPHIPDPELRAKLSTRVPATRIDIGPGAFDSVSVLYSTIYHEYVHACQLTRPSLPTKAAREVEAYALGISRAEPTGTAGAPQILCTELAELRRYYLKLTPAEKATRTGDYEGARRLVLNALLKWLGSVKEASEFSSGLLSIRMLLKTLDDKPIPKEIGQFDPAITAAAQRVFGVESRRLRGLKLDMSWPPGWTFLKQTYDALPVEQQKGLRKEYDRVLRHLFDLTADGIDTLNRRIQQAKRRKAPGSIEPGFFTGIELMPWQTTLRELYEELSAREQAKVKKRYEAARRF